MCVCVCVYIYFFFLREGEEGGEGVMAEVINASVRRVQRMYPAAAQTTATGNNTTNAPPPPTTTTSSASVTSSSSAGFGQGGQGSATVSGSSSSFDAGSGASGGSGSSSIGGGGGGGVGGGIAVAASETNKHVNTESSTAGARSVVAGLLAGAANIVCGYPFDTVKVRMQEAGKGVYSNAWMAGRTIVAKEGVGALFRGVPVPTVGGALETAVCYFVYRNVIDAYGHKSSETGLPSIASVTFAAGVSGVCLSSVISPFELVKCRLQAPQGKGMTPLSTVRGLISDEGLRGLTRGVGGTMAREIPGTAIFFASYEMMRRQAQHSFNIEKGTFADMCSAIMCGGFSGMTYWCFIYPIDMAKTRAQLATAGSAGDVSILTHMRREYRKCGLRGMYNGIGATMVRAFPSNAAQWVVWELAYHHILPYLLPK